jgi:hypothetical protein
MCKYPTFNELMLRQAGDGSYQGHQLLLGGSRKEEKTDSSSDIASFLHRLGWIGASCRNFFLKAAQLKVMKMNGKCA